MQQYKYVPSVKSGTAHLRDIGYSEEADLIDDLVLMAHRVSDSPFDDVLDEGHSTAINALKAQLVKI
jgi:hypothetical protein